MFYYELEIIVFLHYKKCFTKVIAGDSRNRLLHILLIVNTNTIHDSLDYNLSSGYKNFRKKEREPGRMGLRAAAKMIQQDAATDARMCCKKCQASLQMSTGLLSNPSRSNVALGWDGVLSWAITWSSRADNNPPLSFGLSQADASGN